MYKFSEKQMKMLARHTIGVSTVLLEAMRADLCSERENEKPEPATGVRNEDLHEPFDVELPPAEPKPFTIYDCDDEDNIKRVETMSRLCGRWETKGTRGDIEISRRGEHFILTYLKRNGAPTEDRYVLLWYYGEIYYHCPVCRITVVALDGDTETLMLSPGVDYSRVTGYYNIS